MTKICITGGTGALGGEIIKQLAIVRPDADVYVLSSRDNVAIPGNIKVIKGDLETGENLVEAVNDAEIIIHCASNPRNHLQVDVEGTRNLLNAIDKNRISHFIYISIVGVDKSDYPYYRSKFQVEKLISGSGIPHSILRTTQFHNFVLTLMRSFDANSGIIELPAGMRFQSIHITEVAARMAQLTNAVPSGLLPGMGGPQVLTIETMCRVYLNELGRKDNINPAPMTGERYELFRSGVNLCPDTSGKLTWEQFLKGTLV